MKKQYKQTIAGTKVYELLTIESGRARIEIVYPDGSAHNKFNGGSADGQVRQFIHNAVPQRENK